MIDALRLNSPRHEQELVAKRRGYREHPPSNHVLGTVQLLHAHRPKTKYSKLASRGEAGHARTRVSTNSRAALRPSSHVRTSGSWGRAPRVRPRVVNATIRAHEYDDVGYAKRAGWPGPPCKADERRGSPPRKSPPSLRNAKGGAKHDEHKS